MMKKFLLGTVAWSPLRLPPLLPTWRHAPIEGSAAGSLRRPHVQLVGFLYRHQRWLGVEPQQIRVDRSAWSNRTRVWG